MSTIFSQSFFIMAVCTGVVCLFVFFSSVASAQTSLEVGCTTYQYPWCDMGDVTPGSLVSKIYKIGLAAAGAAAFGVMLFGGIQWMVSGAIPAKQDAMEWITGAVFGVALLFGAYLLLNTINPQLVKLDDPDIGPVRLTPVDTPVQAAPSRSVCCYHVLSNAYQRTNLEGDQICADKLDYYWTEKPDEECPAP